MISIAATSYDPNSSIVFYDISPINYLDGQRRGNVTATLDGNSVVYDTGYSISDQTIKAVINGVTKEQLQLFLYLVSHYQQVILICESGAFNAVFSFTSNKSDWNLNFRLVKQLN